MSDPFANAAQYQRAEAERKTKAEEKAVLDAARDKRISDKIAAKIAGGESVAR